MTWALIAVNGLAFSFELALNDEQREAFSIFSGSCPRASLIPRGQSGWVSLPMTTGLL
jgi:hypothetical protein